MTRAYIALGSNLGDREDHLKQAVEGLRELPGTEVVRVSSCYDTDPAGNPGQPAYLNAVAEIATDLDPGCLLESLQRVESRLGRPRAGRGGPRTIDLDLLFYGRSVIRDPRLTVPHPRYAERSFVLVPMVELEPGWTDPDTGLRMDNLLGERGVVASVRWTGRFNS